MNKTTSGEERSVRDNFRYWGLHVSVCSLPSFLVAYNTYYDAIHCVAAMVIGIAMFVVLFSFISSSTLFRSVTKDPTLYRAIRWGVNLRSSISVFGVFGWALASLVFQAKEVLWVFFVPDLYSGMLAIQIVESLGNAWPLDSLRVSILGDDPAVRAADIWFGDMNSFFPTLATVLVEGVIISISLVTICFVLAFGLRVFEKTR